MSGFKVIVQPRDHAVLHAAYEHQFVRMRDVRRYIFRGVDTRRVRERIYELERAGLIRRDHISSRGADSILRLTEQGRAMAENNRAVEIPMLRRLNPATFDHDSLVVSARFRFKELWDATWIPEGALKKEDYPQIPDGILVFPSRSQVAVEIENSPKGPKRFRELQERWRTVPVKLVLYVATSQGLFRNLQSYFKKGPQDLPFGLVLWSELESGQPKIWTVRGELDLFAKRSM